ncbi:serine/threonine-protein kinase [Streptomyces mobaraensis]|uniref:serine/threonine-protein kinase n=1 Tax=Streptomyces mobaraensis TaxID=35621 RepID=UPI003324B3BE
MNGRVIADRYELATVIGQGGMGQVWTGYDRRLDRRVAVKLLRPDRMAGTDGGDELRRRFVRECRVTAQVDHHGLVTVHDAGSDGEDLYLVMQFVEGADLADHLAEHEPYPWPWAVSVAAQLCSVLAAVHAVPIIHRDLKPRNVMIRPDGSVLVLDLGVASVMDADTTRLTRTGSPIGSPAYMAPEQAMGGAVGPYTDLYALGVLLHELLSGEVPFAGSTALGVLHRHLYEPPVPVRRLRAEVPPALEELVLRLLAKDPQDRPADAQEVYRALVPLLPAPARTADGSHAGTAGGAMTPVTGPMNPTRPFLLPHAPWPDRSTTVPAPAGSAALAGSPAFAGAPFTADTPAPGGARVSVGVPVSGAPAFPAAAGVSVSAGHTPTGGTDVAGAVEEVKRLLDQGGITQAVDILGAILPAAAAEHGEHSGVVRSLRKQYAATLMDDGQYRRALPELHRLMDDYAAETGPRAARQVLRFRYDAAQCLEQLGEAAGALDEYRALLPHFQHDPDDLATAFEIRRRTGHLLLSLGDRHAAHETLMALLFDAERVHGPHHPLPAEIRHTLRWLGEVRA